MLTTIIARTRAGDDFDEEAVVDSWKDVAHLPNVGDHLFCLGAEMKILKRRFTYDVDQHLTVVLLVETVSETIGTEQFGL